MYLPRDVQFILDKISTAGHQGYLVGGCVRNAIICHLGIKNSKDEIISSTDYDITTDAFPREIKKIFEEYTVIETGLKHGTVTVILNNTPYEITTFRTDGEYKDHRRPESVRFTRSIENDLARRDFTVNAIAYNPTEGYIDLYGGIDDIKKGILRCVGDPSVRFDEDALRILRAVRFSSVLGFTVEQHTKNAMNELCGNLSYISGERILSELKKLLCGQYVLDVLLSFPSVFASAVPEIKDCIGFAQLNPHHIYNIYDHTAHAVACCPNDFTTRLAALLHDAGKSKTFTVDSDGIGHFKGHAHHSRLLAESALARFNASNALRDEIDTLIKYHDTPIEPTEVAVKKWLSRLGEPTFDRLMALKIADNCAQNRHFNRTCEYNTIKDIKRHIIDTAPALSLRDLKINGFDLMGLGFKGKAIGEVLNRLLDDCLENKIQNDRDVLLKTAVSYKI